MYPELISYDKKTDDYLMNYSGIGVIAIKAIQEQQKEITSLKEENKNLNEEITEIKKILNTLMNSKN